MSRAAGAASLAAVVVVSAALSAAAVPNWDWYWESGPPVRALLDGRIGDFFAHQPYMGAFAILVRIPFAAIGSLGDRSDQVLYGLGAFPCLLALGVLGVALARIALARGRSPLFALLVGGFTLVNPVSLWALDQSHPEEMLGAALVAGAALTAGGRLNRRSGVLTGLAIATKQWGVLALPTLAVTRDRHVLQRVVPAVLVAVVFTVPMLVGNPAAFFDAQAGVTDVSDEFVKPMSVWWPLTPDRPPPFPDDQHAVGPIVGLVTHPAVALVAFLLPLALARRQRAPLDREAALAILALVYLVRCAFDPIDIGYYHVPFITCLLAFEALTATLVPAVSLVSIATLAGCDWLAGNGSFGLQSGLYLVWATATGTWLLREAGRIRAPVQHGS